MNIEIDDDCVDDIIVKRLIVDREALIDDFSRVAIGNKGYIFDKDPAVDLNLIAEHIEAIEVVLGYYGVELEE